MRKLCVVLVFLFNVITCIGCSHDHKHMYGEWVITETGHYRSLICDECSQPTVEDPHIDNDGDLLCDICNYKLKDNNTCSVNHIYNEGTYIPPIEQTPGDVGDMLYTCSVCEYEEIVNLPQVFSFAITFGFDGYYNSSTGELRNGYNEELNVECKTTLHLTNEELYKIYGIFYLGSIINNTNNINVSEDLIEPSYTIKISYSINYEERNFNIYGASYIDIEEWQEGYNIGNAYYKVLKDYILCSEEYKNLPPNTNLYE